MSKFKPEGRRYHHSLGSSYMGAGRTEDSFTFKSRPSFSKVKQIYGEHLEANHPHYPKVKKHQKVDPEIKQQIIDKITAAQRKVILRQVIVGVIAATALVFLGLYLWDPSITNHWFE